MSTILGLPTEGVYVLQVLSGSPADQAGLQGSKSFIEINNQQVRTGGDVIVADSCMKVNRATPSH